MPVFVCDNLLSDKDLDIAISQIRNLSRGAYLTPYELRHVLAQGWGAALDEFLSDGILSDYEQQRLQAAASMLDLKEIDLQPFNVANKIAMSRCLMELLAGQISPFALAQHQGQYTDLPFILQQSEILIWVFHGVDYFEEKTRRQHIRGSQGVSMRVAKGLYYKVGASQGYSIEQTAMEFQDTGVLALTTKHILFGGSRKSLRIPYRKIVTFQSYNDGIGLIRDAATAKPQNFVTGYGWFVYNLAMNIAARAT